MADHDDDLVCVLTENNNLTSIRRAEMEAGADIRADILILQSCRLEEVRREDPDQDRLQGFDRMLRQKEKELARSNGWMEKLGTIAFFSALLLWYSQGLVEESGRSSTNESDDDDETSSGSEIEDYDDKGGEDKGEDVVLLKLFLKQIEQREWLFFQKIMENDKPHIGDLPVEVTSPNLCRPDRSFNLEWHKLD